MQAQIPPSADGSPQVHPGVADARLLAAMCAARLRQEARFYTFLAAVLKPVEVSDEH